MVLAVGNDSQFCALVEELGDPELAQDTRFLCNDARVGNREALGQRLTELLRRDTARGWFDRLSAKGVPCGPVNDLAGAFGLAADLGLAPVAEIEDPCREVASPQVANPIRLSATPASYRSAPPRTGEDGVDVIGRLHDDAFR